MRFRRGGEVKRWPEEGEFLEGERRGLGDAAAVDGLCCGFA